MLLPDEITEVSIFIGLENFAEILLNLGKIKDFHPKFKYKIKNQEVDLLLDDFLGTDFGIEQFKESETMVQYTSDQIKKIDEDLLFIQNEFAPKVFKEIENGVSNENEFDKELSDKIQEIIGGEDEKFLYNESKLKKLNKEISYISSYLNNIKDFIKIIPRKKLIRTFSKKEKLQIKFPSLEGMIEDVMAKIEEDYNKFHRISKELEIIELKLEELDEIRQISTLLNSIGNSKFIEEKYEKLNYDLYLTSKLNYNELVQSINMNNFPMYIEGREISYNQMGFITFYEKEYEEQFFELFLTYNCHKVSIADHYMKNGKIDIEAINTLYQQLTKRKRDRSKYFENELINIQTKIECYDEAYNNILIFVELARNFKILGNNAIKIEGYIPSSIEKNTSKNLQELFGEQLYIVKNVIPRRDPYDNHSKEKVQEEITPTYLKKNRFSSAFDKIIDLYGVTNYSEIHPSVFLMITFPLIFGTMFGDVGHGLILVLGGLVAYLYFKKNDESKTSFCLIIIYCGLGAIFGGFLYGEAFGNPLILGDHEIRLLLSPMQEITLMIKFSILLGVIVIILGWILQAVNLIYSGNITEAITNPLIKILIIIGGSILIFTHYFDIEAWISPPTPILLVLLPAFSLLVLKIIVQKVKLGNNNKKHEVRKEPIVLEAVIDLSENMLQIISNVASFIRIIALEMAHISLMIVIHEITILLGTGNVFSDIIIQGIVLTFGNAFVIILELIIVFIHTLRLHFYEFFSKFYIGDGMKFQSLDFQTKYSNFILEKLN